MSKEATQKGVSADERDQEMDEIAERFNARIKADTKEVELEPPKEEPEEEEEEEVAEEAKTEEPPPETEEPPAEPVAEAEEEPTLEILVDGERQKVPLSKIQDAGIRTLQKESAADKRLEESSVLRRELQEALAELRQLKEEKTPKDAPLPPSDKIAEELRQIERKLLLEGAETEEDLDAILNRKALLQDQWYKSRREEERRMQAEAARETETAEKSKKLFAAVAEAHPDWQDLTRTKNATGDYGDWDPNFTAWLQKQPPKDQQGFMWSLDPRDPIDVLTRYKEALKPVVGMEEKKARKETLDVVEGGSQKAAPPPPKKPETGSEYVQRLARERGTLGADL